MKDINLDIDAGEIKTTASGDLSTVTDKNALDLWICKTIAQQKGRLEIYAKTYGTSLEDLIGLEYDQSYIDAEIKRDITEALTSNELITDCKDFSFSKSGTTVSVSLTVVTTYGEEGVSYDI